MKYLYTILNSLSGRVMVLLVSSVVIGVAVTAGLGYTKLVDVTRDNSSVRIDRAARAAATILALEYPDLFSVVVDETGRPLTISLAADAPPEALASRPGYGAMVLTIGRTNQGAANLFRYNPATASFDRFETTFRKPDGSMPPPLSIQQGHPAYAAISAKRPFVGDVPVMGRLRLAYLMPIVNATGTLAGALAVDVGWVDDLIRARNDLRFTFLIASLLLLALVVSFGVFSLRREMRPIREIARFADQVASGKAHGEIPHRDRTDEVGALAQGLHRVAILQDDLEYLAYTDTLTELSNRARYFADLKTAVAEGHQIALLRLNLDGFKQINDGYGQATGDRVLKAIGGLLKEEIGSHKGIYRIGADDFAIMLPGTDAEAIGFHKRLGERLAGLEPMGPSGVSASMSIGIALLPSDATTWDHAHRNAELALRRAKTADPGSVVFFAEVFNDEAQRQMVLERRLRTAIENGELHVHIQPQISTSDGSLFGLEALARWTDAEYGPVSPAEFISLAEKNGLIGDIGRIVLAQSCQLARGWLDAGFEFRHISVNVSPIELWQPGFVAKVRDVLLANALPARRLCLEVTESVFVGQDAGRVSRVLHELRALGVGLSLDDFGSGYSSLGYLNQLPFDEIKIDRSFVTDVDTDQRKEKLLRGVVALGAGLGLKIVVEGVETEGEARLVRRLGCDAIQGFVYSRPLQPCDVQLATEKIHKAFVTRIASGAGSAVLATAIQA